MTGYELSLKDVEYLVATATRHHLEQIATPLALTVHTRGGAWSFRDAAGETVALTTVHWRIQADEQLRRETYNLYMSYAR